MPRAASQEPGDLLRPKGPLPEPIPDLGTLYRAHAQTVARWAARLGGPEVDQEDVVQEVFLLVQRLLPDFRGQARITTWLFRITHNVVRHRRRRARLRRLLRRSPAEVATPRPTPVEDLERLEAQALVYAVLGELDDKYRTVLVLFEMEGLSGEEIAQLTGQRLSTVWVRLHRARAQFLQGLKKRARQEPR